MVAEWSMHGPQVPQTVHRREWVREAAIKVKWLLVIALVGRVMNKTN